MYYRASLTKFTIQILAAKLFSVCKLRSCIIHDTPGVAPHARLSQSQASIPPFEKGLHALVRIPRVPTYTNETRLFQSSTRRAIARMQTGRSILAMNKKSIEGVARARRSV